MFKKRKSYLFLLILIILALTLFAVSGCNKVEEDPVYVSEEYGFSIEFPESWSGEFEINPYDKGLIISSEVNEIGTLAYIHKYSMEEWEEFNQGDDMPVPYQILEENPKSIIILIYPGDVNYNLEDENSVKKYEEMTNDLKEGNFIFQYDS